MYHKYLYMNEIIVTKNFKLVSRYIVSSVKPLEISTLATMVMQVTQ